MKAEHPDAINGRGDRVSTAVVHHAELARDLPGTSAATPALLDLPPLYGLRAWFEAPQAPSGWARASRDP